ncbi:type VI secretion system lipoprotein TssJ [Amaricoccus sp.]|uniref:type VI secretion system lipoprotein TssJ n=1 Tax=Amaricoccus sp. TaxID=1872485 RepID=UPI001B4CFAA0|nr:type VI secretion system lipoprotein TssJ [Amaricoccus sp.]MBP7000311.1 type VI secretion system lipoprotein TssJ [Amaricoccus sp.]
MTMMMRRTMLVLTGAAGLVAACGGPPGPSAVTLAFTAQPGANPGPDGVDRPITVQILRLRDPGAFATADMFALTADPAAALPTDIVGIDQVALQAGASVTKAISVEPEATAVGLIALLREPGSKVWRTSFPVSPGSKVKGAVTLGPGGMTLALG